jgi:hypothetical protein
VTPHPYAVPVLLLVIAALAYIDYRNYWRRK